MEAARAGIFRPTSPSVACKGCHELSPCMNGIVSNWLICYAPSKLALCNAAACALKKKHDLSRQDEIKV